MWDDVPPSVTLTASSSSDSVNTYDSRLSLEEGAEVFESSSETTSAASSKHHLFPFVSTSTADDDAAIPAVLPPYRRCELSGASGTDPTSCFLRHSTPQAFGRLFPSMDRLSVRHDDLTPDGNMNLRVDTPLVPGSRRPVQFQLFHLRMHDLARREFSLRRYCRDSGRELCNSKRAYAETSPTQRSVSSAIRSVTTSFHHRRSASNTTASSLFGKSRRPSVQGSDSASSSWEQEDSTPRSGRRPSVVSATGSFTTPTLTPSSPTALPKLVPTNTIKLEFSNYARVDVVRNPRTGSYEFEWWGRKYTWRRVVDKTLGCASFHLVRDGKTGSPVAHVVPEVRSPTQVAADEMAGGWIPPCFMWISDKSIIEAATDIADVIVATGLIALVDSSIKNRWSSKKPTERPVTANADDIESSPTSKLHSRGFLHNMFQRRHSTQHESSPLRFGNAVAAH